MTPVGGLEHDFRRGRTDFRRSEGAVSGGFSMGRWRRRFPARNQTSFSVFLSDFPVAF
jgi:hypothetical protein